MLAFEPADMSAGLWWAPGAGLDDVQFRQCRNYIEHNVCNWMINANDPADSNYCLACRLNTMIPNLQQEGNLDYWHKIEAAKRHLLYSLYQLKLPVISKKIDEVRGLSFSFGADPNTESTGVAGNEQKPFFTGHDQGVITINIAEADEISRTRMREMMQEKYRTLLGHFRHEIGHYYWDFLVKDTAPILEEFRSLFGDESLDYAEAQKRHYQSGPPAGWQSTHISAYASMHPWEDWAETWAHYLHMIDTLETAHDFGFVIRPQNNQPFDNPAQARMLHTSPSQDEFRELVDDWVRLTLGINAISRSMGLRDTYPFVLHDKAREKLHFVHRVIHGASMQNPPN